MPYSIAFPPIHAAPSSPAPVIPVMEARSAPLAEQPPAQTQPPAKPTLLKSRFLEMTLVEFETQGHMLQVWVPWLMEYLWFVPSSAAAMILSQEGISRGRIWTAKELRDLLEVGDITREQLQTLSRIKQEFGVEFARIRQAKEAHEHPLASHLTPCGLVSPWPSKITGIGNQALGSFTPCENCREGTWTSYGGVPFCLRHAIAEAARRKATDDPR